MIKLYPYLTYAGALPFIFCAMCLISDVNVIPVLGDTEKVLSVYGLVIASFIAGAHWGQHLILKNNWSMYLPIFSNINACVLWVSFLTFSFKILLLILGSSFLILLLIDKNLFQNGLISRNYFHTRCWVTLTVISTIIISRVYA
ncbi:DUF3429 domain-containing protein [Emcibacteraceae bacterium]|jgi:hypothetical protein|nr:DUF3429 domain-containing protein [Emcibacteraceae bacterium]MDA9554320.1 DUF3429 domain-containing protein [Emcibacteraceae bacterium]